MSGPVHYSHKDSVAVIRMDDGKVNALGPDHAAGPQRGGRPGRP